MSSYSEFGIYDDPFQDVYMACGGAVGLLLLVGVVVNHLLGNSITNTAFITYTVGVALSHASIAATGGVVRRLGLMEAES